MSSRKIGLSAFALTLLTILPACGVKGPPIAPGKGKMDYIKAYTRNQKIEPRSKTTDKQKNLKQDDSQ